MPESNLTTRRKFLKSLAMLFASGVCGYSSGSGLSMSPASAQEASSAADVIRSATGYRIGPWLGDDFTLGHRLRNGDLPAFPKNAEKSVDFVIVGGGMAGLTSAYYLRDHDFLLLEQYDELGGQSRGRTYKGIDYSLGTAYMGTNDGICGELFDNLGIKPVELPSTKNSWYWEGKWYPDIKGPAQSVIYKHFTRFLEECKPIWKTMPPGEPRLPLRAELEKLDSTPFSSFLQGYDANFVSLLDSLCMSSCCGSTSQLSASTGFFLAQDLVYPSYVFHGGNPAIARALRAKLESTGQGRSVTNAFVWRVDLKDNGASVVYSDHAGSMHRVDCRHAIVTAPPMVAVLLIPDLSDKTKALLLWFKYGSYLVANFCMPKKVFDGAYDNWVGSPFTFSDITLAETPYIASGSYKPEMGSVLTVYQPYSNISPGRAILLAGNREELAASLIGQLSKLVEQFDRNLDEVVLSRWGHAMTIARPGMFSKLDELRSVETGPLTLAHCSMAGLPSAESAISAARRAADRALGTKTKAGSGLKSGIAFDVNSFPTRERS